MKSSPAQPRLESSKFSAEQITGSRPQVTKAFERWGGSLSRTSQSKSTRIVSIQVCRGLAAMLVVLAHIHFLEEKYCSTNAMNIFRYGVLGVDLFFVISGVVISSVVSGKFGSARNAGTFLYRRFARVFPIYWFYTTIVLIAYLINPLWINASSSHKVHILASYVLIPTDKDMLLLQGWTLSYEIYFYLFFFLLLLFVSERAAPWLLGLWGAAIVGWNIWMIAPAQPLLRLLISPLILEFLAGCILYHLYTRARLHPRVGILLIAAALLWIAGVIAYNAHVHAWNSDLIDGERWMRPALYGTFAVLLLLGAMEMERSGLIRYFHFLESIGDWSYSIYLSHVIVIELVGRTVFRFAPHLHDSILLIDAVSLPIVLLVGYLSFRFVEKPIMAALYKRKPSPALALSPS